MQDGKDSSEARVFRVAHVPPRGACEDIVYALKLLANSEAGGNNLTDSIFEGWLEQSRHRITCELRRFIKADNQRGR